MAKVTKFKKHKALIISNITKLVTKITIINLYYIYKTTHIHNDKKCL